MLAYRPTLQTLSLFCKFSKLNPTIQLRSFYEVIFSRGKVYEGSLTRADESFINVLYTVVENFVCMRIHRRVCTTMLTSIYITTDSVENTCVRPDKMLNLFLKEKSRAWVWFLRSDLCKFCPIDNFFGLLLYDRPLQLCQAILYC